MKRTLLALLAFVFIFASCDFQDPNTAESDGTESAALGATASAAGKKGGFAGLPGKGAVLRLKGTGNQFTMDVPGFDDAFCFTVDLFDAASGNKLGQATDCLSGGGSSRPKSSTLGAIGVSEWILFRIMGILHICVQNSAKLGSPARLPCALP